LLEFAIGPSAYKALRAFWQDRQLDQGLIVVIRHDCYSPFRLIVKRNQRLAGCEDGRDSQLDSAAIGVSAVNGKVATLHDEVVSAA
jgi:hypothetical protein